jgi:hypothetical protein
MHITSLSLRGRERKGEKIYSKRKKKRRKRKKNREREKERKREREKKVECYDASF